MVVPLKSDARRDGDVTDVTSGGIHSGQGDSGMWMESGNTGLEKRAEGGFGFRHLEFKVS
jgi:hypothetical protein